MNRIVGIFLFLLLSLSAFAQKTGISYQAVILDPNPIELPGQNLIGQPLAKGKICIKFSFLKSASTIEYEEVQQTITDEFGLINLTIGSGAGVPSNVGTVKLFSQIFWDSSPKTLNVSVSFDQCATFQLVSSQVLNATPVAFYAESVDYKNVRSSPTKLSQFTNDAGYLIPKDLDPLKSDIQTNSSKIEVANKSITDNKKSSDAAILIVNQSITSLDTKVAENTTAIKDHTNSITTISAKLTDQQNQISTTNNNLNTQIGGLQGQINTTNSTVSNLSGATEVVSNKSNATDLGGANPSDQLYPSQKAAKTYIDQNISNIIAGNVPDATTLASGKVQLAGDLGGTATSPTVPALAIKENTSNKSTNVQDDASSDSKYPSVKAVKTYVDQATLGTALQATVDGKADKNSPIFTGTPFLPTGTIGVTQSSVDNSTKLATTAFVQVATAGIALQASVDAKADKNSPTFTGTPSLPTGTIAVTQSAGDNSTNIATTAFVQQAASAGVTDASTVAKGKLKLAGDLAGTADSPTVPGLALKANATDVTNSLASKEDASNKSSAALGTSTTLFPTQSAVKTYVDAQVSSATIVDADASTKGKIQLAGDLTGTAALPAIATGAVTSAKILDGTITTADLADASVSDAKISGVAGSKISGDITGNAANVTASSNTTLTSLTNLASVGTITSGTWSATTIALANGGTGATNSTNALVNLGAAPISSPNFSGTPTAPTAISSTNTTQIATTAFVQSVITTASIVDADASTKGKIQLAGDLTGTAALPAIATGAITSAKIFDGTIATADLADASVNDAKISGVAGSKVSGNITGNAANVTGVVAVANGGTGATTITGIIKGNGTSAFTAAVSGTDYSLVREVSDEFTASDNQTAFTLTQTKASNSMLKMYVNGIHVSKNSFTLSGTTLTYVSSGNGNYALKSGDRIQFEYYY